MFDFVDKFFVQKIKITKGKKVTTKKAGCAKKSSPKTKKSTKK